MRTGLFLYLQMPSDYNAPSELPSCRTAASLIHNCPAHPMQSNVKDRNQKIIALDDIVRVVHFSEDFIDAFPEDEQILISSMVGQFFRVVAIDEDGAPCIMREWHDEKGHPQSHVIALDGDEVEKI